MLVEPKRILLRQVLLKQSRILAHRVQDAALAVDPTLFLRAEQAVEQPVRNLFGRQRTVGSGPAHVPLHCAAERFLRHADLQRSEARFSADLARDDLIHRRTARSAAGEARAGHQCAHRGGVAVERSVDDAELSRPLMT